MANKKSFSFQKVGNTRIIPLYWKIVVLFIFFLLASNFATNYINLVLNRAQQVRLMNQLLIKELKENYIFSSNQFEIYSYDQKVDESRKSLEAAALKGLTNPNSMAFGVDDKGNFLYFSSPNLKLPNFPDVLGLQALKDSKLRGVEEGPLEFQVNQHTYFGYYKYHTGWNVFLVRAEDKELFYQESWNIFWGITALIVLITTVTSIIGVFLLRHLFRFVDKITKELMNMQKTQELGVISLKGAPNDDITYLGLSFNALSSTIRNLMNIFRKFVTQDVAHRAYKERVIRLEGTKQELTILFTDIKGFTYMTETLGNDIIKLLNLHYDKAIRHIQGHDGIVGSIIGDALLAVFGTIEGAKDHRSLKAIQAAYEIQEVAAVLRGVMTAKKQEILAEKSKLSPEEERVFKAVMIEVGVGIDGGEVFYGNIGSYVRMTNTVIGDNVNSASRLEGLTRIYHVPIVVSESIMREVVSESNEYAFVELDKVQVKGKTEGKKIFWPIRKKDLTSEATQQFETFSKALEAYYDGDWKKAEKDFKACRLPQAEVFLERITGAEPPEYWNGVWTMTSK